MSLSFGLGETVMDLAYISDAFSHLTMRGHSAGSWGRELVPEEKSLTVAEKHRLANRLRKIEQKKKQNQPCVLCLENKRRKLGAYIRQKSHEDASVIEEEDEECGGTHVAAEHAKA